MYIPVLKATDCSRYVSLQLTVMLLNSNVTLNYNDVGTYSKAQIDAKDAALQANIDTKVTISRPS